VSGRKRSYLITEKGRETLRAEYLRLLALTEDYRNCVGEEDLK
jgi:DNA-binding PadR family transcriptional regulator